MPSEEVKSTNRICEHKSLKFPERGNTVFECTSCGQKLSQEEAYNLFDQWAKELGIDPDLLL